MYACVCAVGVAEGVQTIGWVCLLSQHIALNPRIVLKHKFNRLEQAADMFQYEHMDQVNDVNAKLSLDQEE